MVGCGSEWKRWEPHIHAPGTVLNNQFGGVDPWPAYLQSLEALTPKIEAIGVTDYYVTESYEEVVRQHRMGRLPGVKLIFPNIEMRLDVAARSGFVNIHLLVSPEDPNHVTELKRLLSRLHFVVLGDRYDCTREELIRLGRRTDPTIVDDGAALRHGATQYKVNYARLKEVFGESDWAKRNILISVAGGADDGTSGIRQAADATMRQEIERFAHVIFSSSSAQREFWLAAQQGEDAGFLHQQYLRHFDGPRVGRIPLVGGQCSFREGLACPKHVNDLLFPGGIDPMHVDGAGLHDVKTDGRLAFMEKIAAFGHGFDHGDFRNGIKFRRRNPGKKLATPQGVGESNVFEFRQSGHARQSLFKAAPEVNAPANLSKVKAGASSPTLETGQGWRAQLAVEILREF